MQDDIIIIIIIAISYTGNLFIYIYIYIYKYYYVLIIIDHNQSSQHITPVRSSFRPYGHAVGLPQGPLA